MSTSITIVLDEADTFHVSNPGYVYLRESNTAIRSDAPDVLDRLGRQLIDAADRLRVAQSNAKERAAARAMTPSTEPFGDAYEIAETFTGEFRVAS